MNGISTVHERADEIISRQGSPTAMLPAPPLAVQCTDPRRDPAWDALVAQHPDSSFFHSSAWARVLCESYNLTPTYFVVRDEQRLHAVLPFMEVRGALRGRRGIGLPFTDRLAPLASDTFQARGLFDAVTAHGQNRRWRSWEVRGGQEYLSETPSSLEFYQHTLDLTPGYSEVSRRFAPSVRRALRKATESDVKVEVQDSPEGMAAYYALHCHTRRRHGVPPQPRGFFDRIYRHVISPGHGHLFLARRLDQPIAGAVFFHWGREAIYKYGGSVGSERGARPNNLLMAHAIESYARSKFCCVDLGRTSLDNDGLRRFKLGWGAEETPLSYYRWDLRKGNYLRAQDRSAGWYNTVFRWLPVPALRAIGSLFYRYAC